MLSKYGMRRNRTSDARSLREFCIGVPVMHQRIEAERLSIALNCFVDEFRIT